jgi:hypothetical protein
MDEDHAPGVLLQWIVPLAVCLIPLILIIAVMAVCCQLCMAYRAIGRKMRAEGRNTLGFPAVPFLIGFGPLARLLGTTPAQMRLDPDTFEPKDES